MTDHHHHHRLLSGSQTVTSPTPASRTSSPALTQPNPPSPSSGTTASGVQENSKSPPSSATPSWGSATALPRVPTCTSHVRSWHSPATSSVWCPSSVCPPPSSPSWLSSSTCRASATQSAQLYSTPCATWWCPWCSSWGFCWRTKSPVTQRVLGGLGLQRWPKAPITR